MLKILQLFLLLHFSRGQHFFFRLGSADLPNNTIFTFPGNNNLLNLLSPNCKKSITTVNGEQKFCSGDVIFKDSFTQKDLKQWTVEHRIATYVGPDYEFVSYQDVDETRYVKDSKLFLKPVPAENENQLRGELNLGNRCTGKTEAECRFKQQSTFLLPPVKSARITSKFAFKYGKVEIKAKLPKGDWIYPQLLLEPTQKYYGEDSGKMMIGYSRGNKNLLGPNGEDVGSKMLYGGAVLGPKEPDRSAALLTRKGNVPFNQDTHLFSLQWEPNSISVIVDGQIYGSLKPEEGFISLINEFKPWSTPGAPFDKEFNITLGVGVGGINDFPDGYKSNGYSKPWGNKERNQLRRFFDAKANWLPTWQGDESALQVESVKVFAL